MIPFFCKTALPDILGDFYYLFEKMPNQLKLQDHFIRLISIILWNIRKHRNEIPLNFFHMQIHNYLVSNCSNIKQKYQIFLSNISSHCAPASLNQNVALFAKILWYRLKYTPGIKFLATLISLKSSQHGGQMAHFEITKSHFWPDGRPDGTILKLVGTSLYGEFNLAIPGLNRAKLADKRWLGRILIVPPFMIFRRACKCVTQKVNNKL